MKKDGVSVREIENFARKYMFESFLVIAIVIAVISSIFDFFVSAGWGILFAGIGAVLSIIFHVYVYKLHKAVFNFIRRKDLTLQIIIGIVRIIFAIFIPFIIFFEMGLLAGLSFFYLFFKDEKKENKEDSSNENHIEDEEHHS